MGKYQKSYNQYNDQFMKIRIKREVVAQLKEKYPDEAFQHVVQDAMEHYIRYTKRKRVTERRREEEAVA